MQTVVSSEGPGLFFSFATYFTTFDRTDELIDVSVPRPEPDRRPFRSRTPRPTFGAQYRRPNERLCARYTDRLECSRAFINHELVAAAHRAAKLKGVAS